MRSQNERDFQDALVHHEIPVDPSFSSQLYSTIHYLYPTNTTSKEKRPPVVEAQIIEKAVPSLSLRNTESFVFVW